MNAVRPRPIRQLHVLLYKQGVRRRLLRQVLCFQIVTCLAGLGGGIILWPLTPALFWFGAGAALSVWNFFSLTKIAPQFMVDKYTSSIGIAFFLRSQFRMLGTVMAIVLAIIWAKAPIWALLTGFSLSMIGIVWCVLRAGGNAPSVAGSA